MAFNRGLKKRSSFVDINNDFEKSNQNSKKSNSNTAIGFHSINQGSNAFRIAPGIHDTEQQKGLPFVHVHACTMEIMQEEYSQTGDKTGNEVLRRRKVYNAKVHGPKDERGNSLLQEDIVESYIEYLQGLLKIKVPNQVEREKLLQPINGYWQTGKWNWGIKPTRSVMCYAWNANNELKLLELKKTWYDDMHVLMSSNQRDIFSDQDEAVLLNVEKIVNLENGQKKTSYKVTSEGPNMVTHENWDTFYARTKVTLKQEEELLANKSLETIYCDKYSMDEFEKAIKGLKYFDQKWNFNLFQDEVWLATVKRIEDDVVRFLSDKKDKDEMFDDESAKSTMPTPPTVTAKSIPTPKAEIPQETTESSKRVTVPKMRAYLKDYIEENYPGEYELPKIKGIELKNWYALAVEGEELPWDTLVKDQAADLPWDMDDKTVDEQIKQAKEGR